MSRLHIIANKVLQAICRIFKSSPKSGDKGVSFRTLNRCRVPSAPFKAGDLLIRLDKPADEIFVVTKDQYKICLEYPINTVSNQGLPIYGVGLQPINSGVTFYDYAGVYKKVSPLELLAMEAK